MNALQTLLATTILITAASAQASLVASADGKTVYDTDLNVTWLSDANYANTSGYNAGGLMNWSQAQSWIASLNASNYLGYNDWRLPTTLQPDVSCSGQAGGSYGLNCTGSEMGHLFYTELGGVAGVNIHITHNANYNLFSNILNGYYWSGTENAVYSGEAWSFGFGGDQYSFGKQSSVGAWAVRTGAVSAVPVPAAVWLLGSGLLGLAGISSKRKTA